MSDLRAVALSAASLLAWWALPALILLVAVAALAGCDAHAQQPAGQPAVIDPSVTWAQLGTALGAILSAAAAAGGSGYVAARRATGSQGLPLERGDQLDRIEKACAQIPVLDERTRELRREQRGIRKTQHRHGQALAVMLAEHDVGQLAQGRTVVPLTELQDEDDDADSDDPRESG